MELKAILNASELNQKIKRIAFEIYERNYTENEIVLAGIRSEGFVFASLLAEHLQAISPIKIGLAGVTVDKSLKVHSKLLIEPNVSVEDKVVIITDDVLNTGRTLMFTVSHFMQMKVRKIQTAVIVNRTHRHFPINADYLGYELSTSYQDHVVVKLSDKAEFGAYLH